MQWINFPIGNSHWSWSSPAFISFGSFQFQITTATAVAATINNNQNSESDCCSFEAPHKSHSSVDSRPALGQGHLANTFMDILKLSNYPWIWNIAKDFIWSSDFWLPKGLTWVEFEAVSKERGIQIAQVEDLYFPLIMSPALLLFRYVVEMFILHPLGTYFGISDENHFHFPLKTSQDYLIAQLWNLTGGDLSKAGLEEGDKSLEGKSKEAAIKRYFHLKALSLRPTKLTKFKESGWKTLWYICSFTFGICVAYNEPWFWDVTECWKGYPYHNLTRDVWSYYMLGLCYYTSITISQFSDVKRKDFMEMLLHHFATVFLMAMSYTVNATRFGVLVLLLHDGADIFLELAKTLNYAKLRLAKNVVFVLLTLVWVITRLYVFPVYLIWSTIYESPNYLILPPAWFIMIGFLCLLYLLNIFWTWFIIKVILDAIVKGVEGTDTRSDDEDSSEDEDAKGDLYRKNDNEFSSDDTDSE